MPASVGTTANHIMAKRKMPRGIDLKFLMACNTNNIQTIREGVSGPTEPIQMLAKEMASPTSVSWIARPATTRIMSKQAPLVLPITSDKIAVAKTILLASTNKVPEVTVTSDRTTRVMPQTIALSISK